MLLPTEVPVMEGLKCDFDAMKTFCKKGSRGAEIGVRRCRMSKFIIENVDPSRFLMIDPWKHFPDDRQPDPSNESQESMDLMYNNAVKWYGNRPCVEIRRTTSLDATKWVGHHELDWVFVDGDHTKFGCFLDLVVWHEKVRPGGFMLVHDYVDAALFGVIEAVDEFLYRFPDMEVLGRTNEEQYPTLVLRKTEGLVQIEMGERGVKHEPVIDREKLTRPVKATWTTDTTPDIVPADPALARRPTVLHFCQVCWLGSVPLFIADIAKTFPEFHHVMCYLREYRTNYDAMSWIREQGVEVVHWPKVTQEILKERNPAAVVFHNTPGNLIEGEWPYEWLNEWHTMTYHHMVSWPLVPVDLDVFVSHELFNRGYQKCIRRAKEHKFVPPCIDVTPYARIGRKFGPWESPVIGRLHTDHEDRHPPEILDIFRSIQAVVPKARFIDVGGAKYYADDRGQTFNGVCSNPTGWTNFAGVHQIQMPASGSLPPWGFMKSFDIFLMWNKPGITDTWSRVVTEAMAAGAVVISENKGGPTEQIEDGVNGYLVDHEHPEVIGELVKTLCTAVDLRRNMVLKAREDAVSKYGYERLREELRDFFLKAMIGAK